MRSKEISLWLDERWYDALSRQLGDETVEDKLNDYVDQLIGQLPASVREKISREIWEEDQQRLQEMEAAKVFSTFHVREKGQESYFQVEHSVEFLDAARALRRYLRQEPGTEVDSFAKLFRNRESITAEEFDRMVGLRLENTGKVTGAFNLDFDRQEFSALHIMDGWKTWYMADVSTAAYHAFRKDRLSPERRLNILVDRLEGREITWQASEGPEDLSTADQPTFGEGPVL